MASTHRMACAHQAFPLGKQAPAARPRGCRHCRVQLRGLRRFLGNARILRIVPSLLARGGRRRLTAFVADAIDSITQARSRGSGKPPEGLSLPTFWHAVARSWSRRWQRRRLPPRLALAHGLARRMIWQQVLPPSILYHFPGRSTSTAFVRPGVLSNDPEDFLAWQKAARATESSTLRCGS